jgi:N-succinyl-L-ornithine transcarbamylase
MKNFISVADVKSISKLVQSGLDFKSNPYSKKQLGQNKTIGLLFLNPSLRTRISTQVAAKNLGMETIVFNVDKDGWQLEFGDGVVMNGSTTEHVKEAAAVLGQYVNFLGVRSFPSLNDRDKDYSEYVINAFVKYSGVPVVSLESATLHPLQSLADIITIKESWTKSTKPKMGFTWAPHVKAQPHAEPNTFAQSINKRNETDIVITHPDG